MGISHDARSRGRARALIRAPSGIQGLEQIGIPAPSPPECSRPEASATRPRAPDRTETCYEKSIQPSAAANDVDRAKEIVRQLNLAGEIDWPTQEPAPGRLDFAVNRPGNLNCVSVDLVQNRATVQNIQFNSWGVMNALHTFSGTRSNNPAAARAWMLPSIWVVGYGRTGDRPSADGIQQLLHVVSPEAETVPGMGFVSCGRAELRSLCCRARWLG